MFAFGPSAGFPSAGLPFYRAFEVVDPADPIIVIQNDRPTSGPTAVSICSNALILLGDLPIASFEEGTKRATVMANLYETERNAVLRRHPWNCCIKRVVLSPLTVKPAFGYGNQFALPGDCIRVLSVGDREDGDDFQLEGRRLLSNRAVIQLRYVFLNTIEPTWDESLVRAMTLAMAARACYAITASTSLYQSLYQEFTLALREARGVDGQENPSETLGGYPSLLAVRG